MKRRGMFLITTLILIAFLVMLATTMIVSIMTGLGGAGSFNNREIALQAARSGLLYVQSRIESSMYNYQPTTAIAGTFGDGANFTVKETGRAIVGIIDNGNVAGAGDKRFYGVFRCTFSSNPGVYVPADNVAVTDGVYNIPASTYMSINNLSSDPTTTANSFKYDASIHQTIPGQTADIIVDGYASSGDGNLLGHRTVEAMYSISQIGDIPPAAALSRDTLSLTMPDSAALGSNITVGIAPGTNLAPGINGSALASSNGSIDITGVDMWNPGPPASIPGYSQTTQSTLSGHGQDLVYQVAGGPTSPADTFSNLYNNNPITPPAITTGQLPPVRPGAGTLSGGTWVFWNGQPYHYPTDYQAIQGGNPVTITNQIWAGGTVAGTPPTLNGVPPNPTGPQALPAGTSFNTANNQFNISGNDVQATSYTNGAGFTSSNLALMVAPSANEPPTANSAALQVTFTPPAGMTSPQLNVPGQLTIVGNVLGKGSLVTTSPSTGNIDVQGKSQLDPGSDSGVALYSSGTTNLLALDPNQLPYSIEGMVPPPGGGAQAMVNEALAQILQSHLTGPDASGNYYYQPGPGNSDAGAFHNATANVPPYSGAEQLDKLIPDILQNGAAGHCANGCGHSYQGNSNLEAEITAFATSMGSTSLANWATCATTGALPSATPTPTPTPVGGGGGPNPNALNQQFNGLVYTWNGFNVSSTKALQVNGALVDYGGNPNTGTPGGPGGIDVAANNTFLTYDTSRLNNFASWFGGQVTLATTLVSSY